MSSHFADRLADLVRKRGNAVCVGLDPRWESLPADIRRRYDGGSLDAIASAYAEFCCRVIDIVAPLVPVVKPQCAFFEACGPAGYAALEKVMHHARSAGVLTILDGKRNDIASTAEAYADAAFAGTLFNERRFPIWQADAITINPYLGRDAVEPFLSSARRYGGGVFVLVRTSNKGAGQFQDLPSSGRPLYEHVAEAVQSWSRENLGACGLGDVGAVVGATHPAELVRLRQLIPDVIFLIPGYGAQGGGAKDVAPAFRQDGLGAVVNSSRGIIACFKPDDTRWEQAVEAATRVMIDQLGTATRPGISAASGLLP